MGILITGASGFLGSRFAAYMAKKKPEVRLLLGSRSGNCPWLKGLGQQVKINLFEDLKNIDLTEVDYLIHLAAINEHESKNVRQALRVNVEGAWAIMEAVASSGKLKGLIYGSTVHAYGPLTGILAESKSPIVKHPYGFTHQMGEQLAAYASQLFHIPAISLRFTNIVGAPSDPQVNRWTLLVNDLCKEAVSSQTLTLKSPNSQRDFIAMDDACRAIDHSLENLPAAGNHELYNIACGHNMWVSDLAQLIQTRYKMLFNHEVKITNEPTTHIDHPSFLVDTTKSIQWGWKLNDDENDSLESRLAHEIDATLLMCKKG